ncbi:MAG TPA: hypothetical protein DIC30_06820 [Oceanospirillales bacterium]|jgi:hypothetical protein|nr:hypothetical protein [Oleispira sp.]HCM05707.1 hypothetical protein [Oceanospirillales bacterium]|tara:strand:- start:3808 stop:4218 length:411 start_codon:yes stop_codon:yes gene_type:complete
MASISSVGNVTIPAAQAPRRQNERPVAAPVEDKAVTQEQPAQPLNDENPTKANTSQQASEDQQELEAAQEVAQQEVQRAKFNQQATQNERLDDETLEDNNVQRETASANKSAIDTFKQFQNINASPRQGQELNQFA